MRYFLLFLSLAFSISLSSQAGPFVLTDISQLAPSPTPAKYRGLPIVQASGCSEVEAYAQAPIGTIYETRLYNQFLPSQGINTPFFADAQCPNQNVLATTLTPPATNISLFIYRLFKANEDGESDFVGEVLTNEASSIFFENLPRGKYSLVQRMGTPLTVNCLDCGNGENCTTVIPVFNTTSTQTQVVGGAFAGGQFDRIAGNSNPDPDFLFPWRLIQVGVPQPDFDVPAAFCSSDWETARIDLSSLRDVDNPWTSLQIQMCYERPDKSCHAWTSTGWLNDRELRSLLVHGGVNFMPYLEDIWRTHHQDWWLWPGNYRITLVLKTDNCDGWESIEKSFTVINCRQGENSYQDEIISDIKIYPNPAKDHLNISLLRYDNSKRINFSVHSLVGQTFIRGEITGSDYQIDTSELTGGLYILRIEVSGEDAYVEKFLVSD